MSLHTWLLFCVTETLLCFSPGPAVLLVVSMALGRGFKSGLAAAGGILAANTLYFGLSAAGIGAALATSPQAFLALKWAGAAYLVWVGLRMMVMPAGASDGARGAQGDARSAWWKGCVVQGANPKAIIFFTALLPQFLNPRAPVAPQIGILAASSIVIELAVLTLYATVAVSARQWAGPRFAGAIERAGGAFLVAAGARLAGAR